MIVFRVLSLLAASLYYYHDLQSLRKQLVEPADSNRAVVRWSGPFVIPSLVANFGAVASLGEFGMRSQTETWVPLAVCSSLLLSALQLHWMANKERSWYFLFLKMGRSQFRIRNWRALSVIGAIAVLIPSVPLLFE